MNSMQMTIVLVTLHMAGQGLAGEPLPCRMVKDSDVDGKPDWIEHYTYNTHGHITSEGYDKEGDGAIDETKKYERRYDSQGRQTYQKNLKSDVVTEYKYNQNGDISAEKNVSWMGTTVTRYSYDAQRRMTRRDEDRNNDGAPDEIYKYNYDGKGRLVGKVHTRADNTPAEIWRYRFGLRCDKPTEADFDHNGDGVFDFTTRFTYDRACRQIKSVGVIGTVNKSTFDSQGRLVSEEFYDKDGRLFSRRTYLYDCSW